MTGAGAKLVPHAYGALQGKRASLGANAPLDRAYDVRHAASYGPPGTYPSPHQGRRDALNRRGLMK